MNKLLKFAGLSVLSVSMLGLSVIAVASPTGNSTASISIRTHKWMDADNYYLGVIINGISPEQLQIQPQGRSLYLHAKQEIHKQSEGSMSSSSGFANVSTMLPPDANIEDLKKVITGNDLVIVIPRQQQ